MSTACSSSGDSSNGNTETGNDGGGMDGTTPPVPDSGTPAPDSGTPAHDSGTPAPDSGTHDAGSADGGGLNCDSYCATVNAACTGANKQYADEASCKNACSKMAVGTAADTSGNTLGCRVFHATLASSTPNPHCWHAGPYGYGGCGDVCASFCKLATTWCTPAGGYDGGAPPYASEGDCMTACAGFRQIDGTDAGVGVTGGFNASGPAGGNTLDCREYHLGASFAGGPAQQLHCQHPGATSITCN
jgi:hypothetical protein